MILAGHSFTIVTDCVSVIKVIMTNQNLVALNCLEPPYLDVALSRHTLKLLSIGILMVNGAKRRQVKSYAKMKRWLPKACTTLKLKLFCLKKTENQHLTRRLIAEE